MPDTNIAEAAPSIGITDSAANRISVLAQAEGKPVMLRVLVSGGGCAGFQYSFALEENLNGDDKVFEKGGVKVLVDEASLDLVKGSELDFVEDLIGSYFRMNNPNATSTCGCGTSFSV